MSEILRKICKTIEKHGMLEKGESVLVALSGGADSVCLLTALYRLKEKYEIKLLAAHLNHMLRGAEAESDEKFAGELCKKLGVSFFSKKADVSGYAKEAGISTEEAGRCLRYEFFDELCKKHSISKIATAHNSNDNAETVLMRFIRGTGTTGLGGIPYVNNNIVRPLLDISRDEIEAFLREENRDFVTDRTNKEAIYFRNKVRLKLIPTIEREYNPNFTQVLSGNISGYRAAADFLKQELQNKASKLIKRENNYLYVELEELKKQHEFIISGVIITALSELAPKKQITSRAVAEIAELAEKSAGSVEFSKDLYVYAMYDRLFFVQSKKINQFSVCADKTGSIFICECGKNINLSIAEKKEKKEGTIYLDYDKIADKKLIIRNRREGDFFFPSGMKGKKKLKDFLIDRKIPVFLRDALLIFEADGEIVCVDCLRESEKYKVGCDTKHILKIEISNGGWR